MLRETGAVRRAGDEARGAERALRFNPLRRRDREEIRDLARRLLARDLCAAVETLAQEAAAFAGREDLAADVARARRDLPDLAAATVRAVDVPLPVAVALRRPFHRLLEELHAPSRPAA
ncbi:hypothetical protein [Streptomyces lavendulae]|uniref:hypothetical protein n=1 Tax=Streptomyces lavendulae TaxID=1914 RepID=UPI00255693EB|nr:hypothetical protein [Streptomyces lavendulae]